MSDDDDMGLNKRRPRFRATASCRVHGVACPALWELAKTTKQDDQEENQTSTEAGENQHGERTSRWLLGCEPNPTAQQPLERFECKLAWGEFLVAVCVYTQITTVSVSVQVIGKATCMTDNKALDYGGCQCNRSACQCENLAKTKADTRPATRTLM